MLLFFIYAALGVELFGELVCNQDYPCEGMSRHATFENFGMAFLTLFQVSTGDNWNGIMKDTLRECPTVPEYACNPSLQFISPMYFVSFVLTAQFVLINVVVAVLMKHLDDSNKEAQEEAEMDAEIELELAQGGLCCMGGGAHVNPNLAHVTPHSAPQDPHHPRKLYSPAQENLWLDSVSLLIKDSFEGELLMIDNLSGSVFHHYSSPPICKDCKRHPQEIRLAEVEQASLRSEQLSDKSSSPALPDDLSLDDHSVYQLLMLEGKDERGSSDSPSLEEAEGSYPHSPGSEGHPQNQTPQPEHSPIHCTGDALCGGSGAASVDADGSSPLFHLPAEFFHPAAAAPPAAPRRAGSSRVRGSRLPSPASWASLRSPGANSRVLGTQYPSHSDSSLATGSSEGSLQTTLEEGLSFSVSPPRDTDLPLPLICPLPEEQKLGPLVHPLTNRPAIFNLQATRGHQRSQSSCGGSMSPGCNRQDSMDPSDEDLGIGVGGYGSSQAGNSEHLSETLSSLSLTSLLSPNSLAPPLVKKCNSTGSLDQASLTARGREVRQICGTEPQGYLSNPCMEEKGNRGGGTGVTELQVRSTSQTTVAAVRKNR
ncbi:hypothetical protein SKAU_G00299790 [Synaphobranchus kaupii]|uniref:Ion transport domain-containing protein n=1 Tax=Synaphobranchus kaupii TaxID=118154 RepID=A0A9Q1EVB9_SYNKA|nr:hypothetical protein SKAU_G00299790 [Synaphobranchus kaupii]